MASIFTFDPNPPRVSSPWLTPTNTPPPPRTCSRTPATPQPAMLAEYGVTKLEAEPQEGPMEYKLHLLLRPRRTYQSSTTGIHVAGSHQSGQRSSSTSSVNDRVPPPAMTPSSQSRQNRLEHLTTQLLWRLQQSSPYHTSTAANLVLPKLPETISDVATPSRPQKLIAGLEDSHGALYEIGVTDDGSFVGLTEDEMNESLTNLRAMAASLGCNVEILRTVNVGQCEWEQRNDDEVIRHADQLWVAEALVKPDLSLPVLQNGEEKNGSASEGSEASASTGMLGLSLGKHEPHNNQSILEPGSVKSSAEQLRITLTGSTTAGKSSILGTLSTSTLDDGKGKSRILKHRHELASGVTSSVVQELFGYKDSVDPTEVINYASGNVTSWNDVHAASDKGRLVFMTDCAGHPRYRATTLRGIVGWAPHWHFLCVAADDGEKHPLSTGAMSTPSEFPGLAGASVDLSKAHLELCLKLQKPLVIVVTKLDLVSTPTLKITLAKILTILKNAGRIPKLLLPDQTKIQFESELGTIPRADTDPVSKIIEAMDLSDLKRVVPIITISATKGNGIRKMHALLKALPIPPDPTSSDLVGNALNPEQPQCLFHIEEVYGIPASYQLGGARDSNPVEAGTVIAGYMRFGSLSVGQHVVIGPFHNYSDEDSSSPKTGSRNSPTQLSGSFKPSPIVSHAHPSPSEIANTITRENLRATVARGEWYDARIISLRNLRLPVQTLESGKVGTIGIIMNPLSEENPSNAHPERPLPTIPRIRKGMVVAVPSDHMIQTNHSLQSVTGLTASFEDPDIGAITPGSEVVLYIASVRAAAKVLRLTRNMHMASANYSGSYEDNDIFGLDDTPKNDVSDSESHISDQDIAIDVTLELKHREWIELGSQILIMPGGGQGLSYGSARGEKGVAGLEGYAGRVVEVMD